MTYDGLGTVNMSGVYLAVGDKGWFAGAAGPTVEYISTFLLLLGSHQMARTEEGDWNVIYKRYRRFNELSKILSLCWSSKNV